MSNDGNGGAPPGEPELSSSARVVGYVRDAIADGVLWPNQRLVEAELAEKLGVSRTPVREAIAELIRLGLVRAVRNRGAFVVPTDQREVQELAAIRSVLEGLAGRLATAHIPVAEIDAIEGFNTEMTRALDAGNIENFVEMNSRFHRTLYSFCNNKNLLDLIQNLRERTWAMRMRLWRSEEIARRSVGEHAEIVAATRRRDSAGVEHLLRLHIKGPQCQGERH